MTTFKSQTWWTRLTDRIKHKSDRHAPLNLPPIGDDGLLSEPLEYPGSDGETPADKPPGALSRWTKRDQTLTKLQEGYERVTQVVEEVQKHLAAQGERTERICNSLDQLARSMSDLPTTSRQQVQTLESIAGQLESTNNRTQQLAEAINEIPKVARTQNETLSGIKRQLDVTGEQHLMTGQTMEKLSTAIGTLGEFNSAQAKALQDMNGKSAEQNELLTRLIAKQSKRFTMLFVVTIVLAVAAVAASIIALVLHR